MTRITVLCLITSGLIAATTSAEDKERREIPAAAKAILVKADVIELYSIDPTRSSDKPKENVQGWKVLGQTTIKDADARKKLSETFEKGITEYKDGPAKCFNPRHAIRVTHDGKTADFVICYECYQIEVVVDKKSSMILTSRDTAKLLNELLDKAGVPKPKN